MNDFDRMVSKHLRALPDQLTSLLTSQFKSENVVQLDHLLPPTLGEQLGEQALGLLETGTAKRRDVKLAITGDTPRAYHSVGRDDIRKQDGVITRFFESEVVRGYLSSVAGEPLHKVPYAPEEYIVNSQQLSGDTHGWHWDDYTFALIWVVEAPHCMDGGRVEYIVDTEWDKDQPKECLDQLVAEREIRSRYVPAGSCYLMRANTTLHRVAPLNGNSRRTVIVFTYASQSDLTDTSISHETMEEIYRPEIAA